jgi:carbonic anhydrase
MEKFISGVLKFQERDFPHYRAHFNHLAEQQNPKVLFITCSDSRISPELITQSVPGDLFVIRNAGHIIPPHGGINNSVEGSIEYAVSVLKVEHIIICGHTDCGALKGALNPSDVQQLPAVKSWLQHAKPAADFVQKNYHFLSPEKQLDMAIQKNVLTQLKNLKTLPCVKQRFASGDIRLHGWTYNIKTGEVLTNSLASNRFQSISLESMAS